MDTKQKDLIATINDLDSAWNAHDINRVLNLMSEDSIVRFVPPPPGESGIYNGKSQVKRFVETQIPGFRVQSKNHKVSGDRITWTSTVSNNVFKQMGADKIDCTCDALVQGGKIKSFNVTLDETSQKKLMDANTVGGARR